jgi:hypothetical protein
MPDLAASAPCGVTTRKKSRRVNGDASCNPDAEGGSAERLAFVGMRAYLDGRDDHEE